MSKMSGWAKNKLPISFGVIVWNQVLKATLYGFQQVFKLHYKIPSIFATFTSFLFSGINPEGLCILEDKFKEACTTRKRATSVFRREKRRREKVHVVKAGCPSALTNS